MDRIKNIIEWMGSLRSEKNVQGMKRFGINSENAFGIPIPALRAMARQLGKDQPLALELWDTEFHEARLLAGMVAVPGKFTPELMDSWCGQFDSWDICDQTCLNLFRHTTFAYDKIDEWAGCREEFVRRAAFALIATCAVHDKNVPQERFEMWFRLIEQASEDDRNFVKKAVNWALRQLGKRSPELWYKAIAVAEELMVSRNKTARWIGTDATRELTTEKVIKKLNFG